jgi:hypothetical protein
MESPPPEAKNRRLVDEPLTAIVDLLFEEKQTTITAAEVVTMRGDAGEAHLTPRDQLHVFPLVSAHDSTTIGTSAQEKDVATGAVTPSPAAQD